MVESSKKKKQKDAIPKKQKKDVVPKKKRTKQDKDKTCTLHLNCLKCSAKFSSGFTFVQGLYKLSAKKGDKLDMYCYVCGKLTSCLVNSVMVL